MALRLGRSRAFRPRAFRSRLALALVLVLAGAAAAGSPLPRFGPAFNFALTAPGNTRVWLAHFRDRVVTLAFTCTTCTSCPGVLPALASLSRTPGAAAGPRVALVVVSLDARRDTPAVLRQFAQTRGFRPPAWHFLTGTPAEAEAVARRYGVEVRWEGEHVVEHACQVTLIDGRGTIRARYGARELGHLEAGVAALLEEAGRP